jgi:tetratricopeptide (TPR) repeat protein
MKKLILTIGLSLIGFTAFAQTAFEKAMTEKIAKVEDHKTPDEFTALANDFDRIGTKESKEWLPYYYAAFATIQKGRILMRGDDKSGLDAVATEAEKYIAKAEALSPNNAELFILKKMTSGLRMMADPMSRYMSEAPIAQQALAKATELDPNNPRITVLKAEDLYFTPEQFGGSKEKGLEMFKKAIEQFGTYKSKTSLDPKWGKAEAEYFLSQK